MPQNTKIALGIVIAVVVIGIGWWMFHQNVMAPNSQRVGNLNTADTTLTSGNSNDDLSSDMTKIDAQLNAYDQNTASNQGQ